MKVLFFLNDDDKYGAGKSTMKLIELLWENHGVTPILVTPKYNNNNKWCNENGIENYSLLYSDEIIGNGSSFLKKSIKVMGATVLNFNLLRYLEKKIDFSQVDLIHTGFSGIIVGWRLSEKHSIPHIWHLRDFPLTWSFFDENQISKMNSSLSTFVAISDAVKREWVVKGLASNKITKIYNGIDPSTILYSVHKFNESTLKICFVGAMVKHKRPDLVIEAVGKLPEAYRKKVTVDFFGTTYENYQPILDKLVSNYHLANSIKFHGYTANVGEVLNEFDVGIMSSIAEPFGRVTIEYMLAGLSVVASDTGANPELIEESITGFLFESGNYDSLSRKLIWLIDNPNMIKKVGQNSRKYALENYSATSNADKIYQLYLTSLKNGKQLLIKDR
ncbi:glycosyltransferase family 4 protein [Sporolactobacillus terrae]|uniref:glycosyltransferase family 4 protein n=1 Tax=Sporolactobacillus terrae TaxID=269673 RepID=UPI001CBFECEF|nr:glycosyltransferase family 4 protein [Sporolactobacillus terrae]UAK16377.1 glycosyltransferase family 4 protein [Sporolactobacillus terrae]